MASMFTMFTAAMLTVITKMAQVKALDMDTSFSKFLTKLSRKKARLYATIWERLPNRRQFKLKEGVAAHCKHEVVPFNVKRSCRLICAQEDSTRVITAYITWIIQTAVKQAVNDIRPGTFIFGYSA